MYFDCRLHFDASPPNLRHIAALQLGLGFKTLNPITPRYAQLASAVRYPSLVALGGEQVL